MANKAEQFEKRKAELLSELRATLQSLREHFPDMSDLDIAAHALFVESDITRSLITADEVEAFAAKRKTFSTGDVMEHFSVPKGNAAAAIAILRIKSKLAADGKAQDNTSRWRYVA